MTTAFATDEFVAHIAQTAKQQAWPHGTTSREAAGWLDGQDALASMRAQYEIPRMVDVCPAAATNDREASLYLCGNSLGPLPKRSKLYVQQEVEAWSRKAVLGHWDHPFARPWTRCEERVSHLMSDIVGAKPSEVVAMGTLTSNLHIMLATFYRPHAVDEQGDLVLSAGSATVQASTRKRHKIIYEALAFPSDQYALASAVALAGFDPQTSLVALRGRDDASERVLRTEDVLKVIEREAASGELALVLLGDVQYQTGQMLDVSTITRRARELGVTIGWDLAHAFANVPLALHDWDVDFAVWCTYKYGSSGPGGMAGLFVHERWSKVGFTTCIGRDKETTVRSGAQGLPRPAGWWGHKKSTRFSMPDSFDAMSGAAGWQQSNPSALDMAALLGSLETMSLAPGLLDKSFTVDLGANAHADSVNAKSGPIGFGHIMPALRQKSQRLTAYLEHLLLAPDFLPKEANVSIVTPNEARFRGSQLSIRVPDQEASAAPNGHLGQPVQNGDSAASDAVPPPISAQSLVSRVHHAIEARYGVVADIRHPDILRIAPVAQFSTFDDVWRTADVLRKAFLEELH